MESNQSISEQETLQEKELDNTSLEIVKTEENKEALQILREDDLSKLKDAMSKVNGFKKNYRLSKFKITGVDDKKGHDKLKDAIADMRTTRTGLEKARKDVTKPYRDTISFINERFDAVTEVIEKIESPVKALQVEWKQKIQDDKEKEKRELEIRLNTRVEELKNSGAMFDGSYYCAGDMKFEVPEISIGIADIQVMSDELFTNFLFQVSEKNGLVSERKQAESDRLQKEKDEKDAEDEKNRLQLLADQKKLADDKAILDKQKADQEAELLEMKNARLEIRGTQLENIGMVFNKFYQQYLYPESKLTINIDYVGQATKGEWNATLSEYIGLIAGIKKEICDLKDAEEKKQAMIHSRGQQLENVGFIFNNASKTYRYEDVEVENIIIETAPEAPWNQTVEVLQEIITQLKSNAEEKRLADLELERQNKINEEKRIADKAIEDKRIADELAEKNRLEAIAALSDTEQWNYFLDRINSISIPVFKSKKYIKAGQDAQTAIRSIKSFTPKP